MKTSFPIANLTITFVFFINLVVTLPAYSLPPVNQDAATIHPGDESREPQPPVTKRRLLHTENQNDTTASPPIDHRDNFELFATIVGVLGGITLITGFTAFTWSLIKKQKERVGRSVERETSRRAEEGKLLSDLFGHKHSPAMMPSGSTIAVLPVAIETPEGGHTLQEAIQAVIAEDAKLLEQILTDNPHLINQSDSDGNTLLHHARESKIVRLLLRRGAKLSSTNNMGFTPVHMAAIAENQTVLILLLDWMEVITFDDSSALFHIAAQASDRTLLQYLVRRGLHHGQNFERRPFANIRTSQRTVQTLSGATLLHEAVNANNLDAVIYILEVGLVNVNATDDYGNTPLHIAALSPDINSAYGQQQSQSPETIVETLLSSGADINAVNSEGHTPLHRAVLRGNAGTIRALLNHQPNLEIQANGITPVELACLRSHGEIVVLLAPHSRLRNQRRRQHLLQQVLHLNLVETLNALTPETVGNLFDLSAEDENGDSILHTACQNGRSDLVEALLKLGASRLATNKQGQTPRDIASRRKPHVARTLLEVFDRTPEVTQPEAAL